MQNNIIIRALLKFTSNKILFFYLKSPINIKDSKKYSN